MRYPGPWLWYSSSTSTGLDADIAGKPQSILGSRRIVVDLIGDPPVDASPDPSSTVGKSERKIGPVRLDPEPGRAPGGRRRPLEPS